MAKIGIKMANSMQRCTFVRLITNGQLALFY